PTPLTRRRTNVCFTGLASTKYGTKTILEVDASPVKHTFVRLRVSGVGARQVTSALLRLKVSTAANSQSVAGGRIHSITNCSWSELTITAKTQPAIDGPVLSTVGSVLLGQPVDFDVTSAIHGDGVYCFAIDTSSTDGVGYNSREAAGHHPALAIAVTP